MLASVCALFILSLSSSASVPERGMNASLYRGEVPKAYTFTYNGTPFYDNQGFRKGEVFYNGKLFKDVTLNLDAYSSDLQVRPEDGTGAIILYRGQVAWFTLGDKIFINPAYFGIAEAPDAYLELVANSSRPVLSLTGKKVLTDAREHNGTDIGYIDPDYDYTLRTCFLRTVSWYTVSGGTLERIGYFKRLKLLKLDGDGTGFDLSKVSWQPLKGDIYSGTLPSQARDTTLSALPDNYFGPDVKEETVDVQYASNILRTSYKNKVYTVGEGNRPSKGKQKVSGRVLSAETGETLPGVLVISSAGGSNMTTGGDGYYSLYLPQGESSLSFFFEGKEDLTLRLSVEAPGSLDVVMSDKVTLLPESIVSAESMANHRRTQMGVEAVSMKSMRKIPSAFGEGDVLKAVLTLPGVTSVGEASAGFNVRGGGADQNLVLLNGNTIYNPTHMFGIFSSFNPDVVEGVQLYKSSIPASYGGRLSSVLEVKTKDGDFEKWKGSLGLGLLTTRGHVEGPLAKGKSSVILSARTTYSNWMMGFLPPESAYAGGKANFSDANFGWTLKTGKRSALRLNAYFATDRFSFTGDTTYHYTNFNASLQWNHRSEDGSSLDISGGYDYFTNRVGVHSWPYSAYDLDTYIRQYFFRADRKKALSLNNVLSYGAAVLLYSLDPGIMSPFGEESSVIARSLDRETALEPSFYVSDTWMIDDSWSLDGGLRATLFHNLKDGTTRWAPEFRFSAKYSPLDNLSYKIGFNTLRQNIHLISNTTAISPMDTWKLSDADILPSDGYQAAAGVYWTHLGTGLDFSADFYWKGMRNLLDYKVGALLVMNSRLASDLVPVYGRAFGGEVMVKKTTGKLNGWISYGYSRSLLREMQDRGNETISGGNWYNAPYDKPHEFKAAINYAFTRRYSLSLNADYSTGRPVTVPSGTYYYEGRWRIAYSDRNSHRIPDYFRLDAAFNVDAGHYLKALVHANVTIGVYNILGRKNAYSVYFTPGYEVAGYMLSVFAAPIPYVNLNLLF